MKILVRIMSLAIVGIFFSLIFLNLMRSSVIENELISSVANAMTNTQIVATENVEDQIYGTSNARKTFRNNTDYINDFMEQLKIQISSDAKYEVKVFGVDYEKGLLDVEVSATFANLNGTTKTVSIRQSSIVEITQEGGG